MKEALYEHIQTHGLGDFLRDPEPFHGTLAMISS